MAKVFFHSVFGLIMGVLATSVAHATDTDQGRDSLRGVEAVGVHALMANTELERYVSKGRLHTVMSLALRTAGLTVVEDEGGRDGNLVLLLWSLPMDTHGEVTHFAIFYELSLSQPAELIRTRQWGVYPTWSRTQIAVAGTKRVREISETVVSALIDEFLNDRLAAN